MKKIAILLIFMLCVSAVFSQEIVGNYSFKSSYIDIEIDFYEEEIDITTVMQMIVVHIVSTQASELLVVFDEMSNILYDEMDTLVGFVADQMDYELDWGYVTPYFAVKYVFSINEDEYFVINILPEDNFWFFETVY